MRCLLLALVFLAWSDAKHHRHQQCFRSDDLMDGELLPVVHARAARWARHTAVQLVPYLEGEGSRQHRHRRHQKPSCPNLVLQNAKDQEINDRSISPWRYYIDSDEDRYPRDLAFAECLCKGCIDSKTGLETTALNSVPVYQTVNVLHRKPCQHKDRSPGVTFETGSVNVPVGCTCVLPQSSS